MTVANPLFAWLTTRVASVPAGAVPGSPQGPPAPQGQRRSRRNWRGSPRGWRVGPGYERGGPAVRVVDHASCAGAC